MKVFLSDCNLLLADYTIIISWIFPSEVGTLSNHVKSSSFEFYFRNFSVIYLLIDCFYLFMLPHGKYAPTILSFIVAIWARNYVALRIFPESKRPEIYHHTVTSTSLRVILLIQKIYIQNVQ